MSDGIWSAASGAMAQMRALEVAAENVANASTPGYRAERPIFREVLSSAATRGNFALRYSVVDQTGTDPTAGLLEPTGRPLDVAISGAGFFVVKTAQGERYTRCGSFKIGSNGQLSLQDGTVPLDSARKPIDIPQGAKNVSIGADGTVRADGASVGELLRVKFAEPSLLQREGAGLLRTPTTADGFSQAQVAQTSPETTNVKLETGSRELSNSHAVKGMVAIVSASRAFEVCERMVDAFRDADRKAATQVMGPR